MIAEDDAPGGARLPSADDIQALGGQIGETLKALKREQWWRRGLTAMVVLAVLVGAAWSHHQDDVRAANHAANLARVARVEQQLVRAEQERARLQAQNTRFRVTFCSSVRVMQEYLRKAPAGDLAGQRSRDRLIVSLGMQCPQPGRP